MKVSKNSPKTELPISTVMTSSPVPLDQDKYPDLIEGDEYKYYRFYTRPKFIIYEIVNYADMIEGYLCINAIEQVRFERLPYRTLWDKMIEWADKAERLYTRELAR